VLCSAFRHFIDGCSAINLCLILRFQILESPQEPKNYELEVLLDITSDVDGLFSTGEDSYKLCTRN
jgi:hypothetical protein